jgi:bifunctional UDP-N-acetylglucosamine pyrophosphorylase/glucosamine-1-phosphate N-acetyltransferase
MSPTARDVTAVILAAGKGTRMGSDRAKVLHPLAGKPLVAHVLETCARLRLAGTVVVVGHQREEVAAAVRPYGAATAIQDRQLGTGHAVLCAEPAIASDSVLVLCGDTPLIPASLLEALLAKHHSASVACTAVAARLADPGKYGRMITGADGRLARIVEWKDASEAERAVNLINSGIYAFHSGDLFHCLKKVRNDNAQGEYYLTDVVGMLVRMGRPVELVVTDDPVAVMGINTPQELADAERLYAERERKSAKR